MRILGIDEADRLVELQAATPQAAGAGVLITASVAALRYRPQALACLATTACLVAAVAPRVIGGHNPPLDGEVIEATVMSSNLKLGKADPAGVMELVTRFDVDLLALQEVTPAAVRKLEALGLAEVFPESHVVPAVHSAGSAIYSRFPISDPANWVGRPWEHHTAVADVRFAPGLELRVASVHPPIPSPVEHWQTSLTELFARSDPSRDLLIGDFNATLDHRKLKAFTDAGFRDAAALVGAGLPGTFNARLWPRLLQITIDHVLVGPYAHVTSVTNHRVSRSDHRGLIAVLELPACTTAAQRGAYEVCGP